MDTGQDRTIVYVVDDDREIRLSLSFLLRNLGYEVHPFVDAGDFLESSAALKPGCILLDIRMPNMDGGAALLALRQRGITWPVVIITGHAEVSVAVDVMKNGAMDFLEKPFDDTELVAVLDRGFAQLRADAARAEDSHAVAARLARLSLRERDVLNLMLEGRANKTIAQQLNLSTRTVEMHRANLFTKLGSRNLAEVAALVARATRA